MENIWKELDNLREKACCNRLQKKESIKYYILMNRVKKMGPVIYSDELKNEAASHCYLNLYTF